MPCNADILEHRELVALVSSTQEELVEHHAAREYLVRLLTSTQGNVSRAAREIAVERQSLHRRMRRHGLRGSDFRPKGPRSAFSRSAMALLKRLHSV